MKDWYLSGMALVVLWGAAAPAAAATRYVSTAGADAGSGSMSSPFQTIQRCATASAAGDTCVVAAGTYRETVTPNDGTTFVAAPGATVTVDGSDPVTGWTLSSGKIYKAPVTAAPALKANQVFVGGTMEEEARFPNTGWDVMKPNWAIMDSGSNNTTIVDSALQKIDWTGATVKWWAGTNPYGMLTATVTGSSAGRVTFTNPWPSRCPFLCPRAGGKFYIIGKLAALDSEGEWFYDKNAAMLYLWAPGGASPTNVAMKMRDWAFNLNGRSNVTIRGINIFSAGISMDAQSSGNMIDGIQARYVAHYIRHDDPNADFIKTGDADYGILLKGTGNTLRNSNLQFSAGSGVVVAGARQTVTNNLIRNMGYGGNYGAGVYIVPFGDSHTITYNTIAKMGRAGITVSGYNADTGENLTNSTIAYNNVYGHNMMSVDSGAIYVCCQVEGYGSDVHHNWTYDDRDVETVGYKSYGIFFDNSSENFSVRQNFTWKNNGGGIKVHGEGKPAAGFLINGNTLNDPGESIGFYNVPTAAGSRIEYNKIYKPIYFSTSAPATGIFVQENDAFQAGAERVTVGCNIVSQCTEGETPPN